MVSYQDKETMVVNEEKIPKKKKRSILNGFFKNLICQSLL